MSVAFDIGFEIDLSVGEGDYHYDENDECSIWLRIGGCGYRTTFFAWCNNRTIVKEVF